METFIVTYDFTVFKPSSLTVYDRQKAFIIEIIALNEVEARQILLKDYNKNPFYFKFLKK